MMRRDPNHQELTIRDLMEEFNVTARALRFYETKGLLAPERRGRARVYSRGDRARLMVVLRGRRVGFSLDDIREMLDLHDTQKGGRAALLAARAKLEARAEQLHRQREDIDAALEDLAAGLEWLDARIACAEPSDELKSRAAAFEALTQSWLWDGDGPGARPRPAS